MNIKTKWIKLVHTFTINFVYHMLGKISLDLKHNIKNTHLRLFTYMFFLFTCDNKKNTRWQVNQEEKKLILNKLTKHLFLTSIVG